MDSIPRWLPRQGLNGLFRVGMRREDETRASRRSRTSLCMGHPGLGSRGIIRSPPRNQIVWCRGCSGNSRMIVLSVQSRDTRDRDSEGRTEVPCQSILYLQVSTNSQSAEWACPRCLTGSVITNQGPGSTNSALSSKRTLGAESRTSLFM